MSTERKIIVTGGAGLVGQNLIQRLTKRGYSRVVAIDKHPANTATLARLNPRVEVIDADLAQPGVWEGGVRRGGYADSQSRPDRRHRGKAFPR